MLSAKIASGSVEGFCWVYHAKEELDDFFAFVFVLGVGLDDGLAGEDEPLVLQPDLDVDEGNVDADEYALSGLHNLLKPVLSLKGLHNHDGLTL